MNYYYNYWLVALSFLLAVLAAYTALSLAARLPHIPQQKVWQWLGVGAFAMGVGIWAMHFVGMLAFHLPIPLAYDVPLTLLSVLFAVGASGFALYLIRHGITRLRTLLASAALMGGGIAAMHYTGMAALRMSPPIDYDGPMVLLSLLIAFGASLYALKLAFHNNRAPSPLLFSARQLLSAVVMGVAVAGMHYVAMEAASFSAGSLCLASPKGIDNALMATIVASVTLLLLLATLLLLSYDAQVARQNALLVEELKGHNERLRQEAERLARSMTESLRQSHQRDHLLAAIVEQSGEAIITLDLARRISNWNRAAEAMFGYSRDEAIGQGLAMLEAPVQESGCHTGEAHEGGDYFVRCRTRQGEEIYVNRTVTPLLDEAGECLGEIILMTDVTREKLDHDQLTLWGMVYQHSGEAIVITDEHNRILSVNNSFSRITGYGLDEVVGKNPKLLASGRHEPSFYHEMWRQLQERGYWKGEVWNRRKDGTLYPEWLTITTLRDNLERICNYIAIFSDASSYKEKEARIHFLAHHDALTGLPNRVLLQDRLEQAIAKAQRHNEKIAILFIDLDRFKVINDSLGHHVGDMLLKEVAKRLNHAVRSTDTVCRQGGDEFIIILPEVEHIGDVAHLAGKLLENIAQPFMLENELLSVTPSIGISLYPDDAVDIEQLIKNADTAMYHAKESGRANFQFFTEQLNAQLTLRLELERDLATAIDRDELSLQFQPQFDLRDGRIIGAEALLRWHHPRKGAIAPLEFIAIAEESGLINRIGLWVLERLLQRAVQWQEEEELSGLILSANVSARQLDDHTFIEQVQQLFARYPYPPECIELELTETAVMSNIHRSITHLGELKELGIQLAIDDFGTGYSSLNYLKRLPIDKLKIDRSFISDIPGDKHDVTITQAIIKLAQTLGLGVIAEGVESEEQVRFLLEAGCYEAQGYYCSRALSEEAFVDFVRARAR